MAELDLISEAVARLREIFSTSAIETHVQRSPTHKQGRGADAMLTVLYDGSELHFLIEAKQRVTTNTVARFTVEGKRLEISDIPLLVIAEYIQPAARAILERRQLNYLDLAGNCHISAPPLFIHSEGRKPVRRESRSRIRAFSGEGLKVVFAFLLDPKLTSRTYRELVKLCAVSQGVVQYTMEDLENTGFVDRSSRTGRRLPLSDDLLDRWVEGYIEALRPKLSLGLFRFRNAETVKSWKDIDLDPRVNRWGGEPAADFLTQYLRPGRLTMYTRASRPEALKELRIVPDEEGHLELFRTFWTLELESAASRAFPQATVPPLLAYADLTASADPRNAEVAAMLRERLVTTSAHD